MIRENNIKNRAISVFLVISMLVTSLFNSIIAMAFSESSAYEDNIGCTAVFNTDVYDYFPVSDDPSNLSWDSEHQLIKEDLEEGFKVVITDYYISDSEGDLPCLWYKVKAAPDCEAPEKLIQYPWVYQNYLGENAEQYDSLIISSAKGKAASDWDEYASNIGAAAKFNPVYFGQPVFLCDDPDNFSWSNNRYAEELFSNELKLIIKDYHIDSENRLFYKVATASGQTLPEILQQYPWVYQNDLADSGQEDTLILTKNTQPEKPDSIQTEVNGAQISVSGALPEGVTVSAKTVTENNVGKYGIKGEVVAALDIKLLGPDSNEVQPSAPVTVTLDASAWGLEDGSVVNIHHDHDGNVSVMSNYLVLNGKLTFPVSDFSIFIVENVTDITGTPITEGNYEMTVGESKVFYWALQNGSLGYDCVWYVEDPDGLIDYEVTKYDYDNEQYTAPWITVKAIKASTDGDSFATITLKYENGNSVNQETFNINVANPDSDLYIDNQIPENGCLVPQWKEGVSPNGVTYTWSRSSGVDAERKVILEEAYNEANNGVNVSIDGGGVINGRDPITYTVTAKDADGKVLGTAKYKVLYGGELLNTSFEYPDFSDPDILNGVYPNDGDTKFYVYNGYPGFYWKTTAPGTTTGNDHNNQRLTDDIEIIQAGGKNTQNYYGLNVAAEGKQFAEVNAENFGALYQDVLTTPGAQFTWQFSHRGRNNGGENTLFIVVAATKNAQTIKNSTDIQAFLTEVKRDTDYQNIDSDGEGILVEYNGAEYRVWKHEGDTGKWDKISGTYDVPADQYLTRLFFVSDTNNNDNNTMGNFIDAVSAGETLSYQIKYYVDGIFENSTEDRAQVHSYTSETFPTNFNLSKYSITTVTANGITYPYDLNLKDGAYQLYITEYGTKEPGQAADIIFEIHLRSRAITVTKKVVIDGFDTLDADQRNVIIKRFRNDGFVANFTLSDANNISVNTPVVVRYIAETNEFIGTAEFDLTNVPDGTYIINEDSCTGIPGYILTKTEFSGGNGSDDYEVIIGGDNPVVAITCTNTYKRHLADLTITKKGADQIDENQTFIFKVKGVPGTDTADIDLRVVVKGNGSVTIKDLPIGRYIVEEETAWSWRYEPNEQSSYEVELKTNEKNEVPITNNRKKRNWLNGAAYCENLFTIKEKETVEEGGND